MTKRTPDNYDSAFTDLTDSTLRSVNKQGKTEGRVPERKIAFTKGFNSLIYDEESKERLIVLPPEKANLVSNETR